MVVRWRSANASTSSAVFFGTVRATRPRHRTAGRVPSSTPCPGTAVAENLESKGKRKTSATVIDGGATAYRNLGGAQFHQRVTADAGPGLTPQGVFARRRWPPSWAAAPRRATSFANPREIEVYCCLHPARITDSQRN